MGDYPDFVNDIFYVMTNAIGFLFVHQATLQFFVMGSYTCRAGVLVALQRLDTPQGEHKASRGDHEIRSDTERLGDRSRCNQLARGNDLSVFAKLVFP